MSRISKAIVFVGALMMINICMADGAHWEFSVNQNGRLCFEQTEKVASGADPETLSTIYCKRALRVEPLGRKDRSAILYNRGIIQKAQGNLAAARASFKKAVRLSVTTDRRNLALAEVARELGDFRVAFEQYDLLAESAFVAGSQRLQASVYARLEEADAAYFASVKNGQACTGCHGVDGISIKPGVPTLAGRNEDFIEHALRQFKNGERQSAVMAFQTTLIDDEDMPVLADYFASLSGPAMMPIE